MDGWYYKVFGSDFGPVPIEDLVELAKTHTLATDDEVKFGKNGQWRRAGSIGQLMAHFPFEAVEKVITVSNATPASESWSFVAPESAPKEAYVPNHAGIVPNYAPVSVAERQAPPPQLAQPTPPPQPTAPPPQPPEPPPVAESPETATRWWCIIDDNEYGPVDLKKIIEWAETGRLRRTDHVRFGLDAYSKAGDLPGLFPQLPGQSTTETKPEVTANSDTKTLSIAAPTPVPTPAAVAPVTVAAAPAPATAPVAVAPTPVVAIPAPVAVVAPAPAPVAPAPQMMRPMAPPQPQGGFGGAPQGGFGGQAGGFGGAGTPGRPAMPQRPAPRSSGISIDFVGLIKGPVGKGIGGALVLAIVYFFILPLMAGNPGLAEFKELVGPAEEFVKAASDEAKPAEIANIAAKCKKASEPILKKFKKTAPTAENAKMVLSLARTLDTIGKDPTKAAAEGKKLGKSITAAKKAFKL